MQIKKCHIFSLVQRRRCQMTTNQRNNIYKEGLRTIEQLREHMEILTLDTDDNEKVNELHEMWKRHRHDHDHQGNL